jgi:hypothetical protein
MEQAQAVNRFAAEQEKPKNSLQKCGASVILSSEFACDDYPLTRFKQRDKRTLALQCRENDKKIPSTLTRRSRGDEV